ncbi:MAG: sulfatase-like hydrolase/transferase, partial [Deltaproteobacteria bacterium]|nr:sulfatase-like hydrolase/transferase [Deltaproteobacteria bacterium]
MVMRRRPSRSALRSIEILSVIVLATVLLCSLSCRRTSTLGDKVDFRPDQGLGARHVIIIVLDTMRADAASFMDPKAGPTPNIDRLAADSIVFTQARSTAAWTLPSMVSIMTGLSTDVHGTWEKRTSIHEALPTLADFMREAGYHTAAIGSNIALRPGSG